MNMALKWVIIVMFAQMTFNGWCDMPLPSKLETWEGVFGLQELVELEKNNDKPSLFAYIYTEGEGGGYVNLVECYWYADNGYKLVMPARTEIYGTSFVLLSMGTDSTANEKTYWMLWRVPGHGGSMYYERLILKNDGAFFIERFFRTDKLDGLKWHPVLHKKKGMIRDELGPEIKIDFTVLTTLWTNTSYGGYCESLEELSGNE